MFLIFRATEALLAGFLCSDHVAIRFCSIETQIIIDFQYIFMVITKCPFYPKNKTFVTKFCVIYFS